MFQREEKRWEKFLVRGSAEGCLLVWKVPDTKECNALQVKAETADKPPALEPIQDRSLAHCWATTRPQPVGVLDQMCIVISANLIEPYSILVLICILASGNHSLIVFRIIV